MLDSPDFALKGMPISAYALIPEMTGRAHTSTIDTHPRSFRQRTPPTNEISSSRERGDRRSFEPECRSPTTVLGFGACRHGNVPCVPQRSATYHPVVEVDTWFNSPSIRIPLPNLWRAGFSSSQRKTRAKTPSELKTTKKRQSIEFIMLSCIRAAYGASRRCSTGSYNRSDCIERVQSFTVASPGIPMGSVGRDFAMPCLVSIFVRYTAYWPFEMAAVT
jgi:hypothetical protein